MVIIQRLGHVFLSENIRNEVIVVAADVAWATGAGAGMAVAVAGTAGVGVDTGTSVLNCIIV